MRGYRALTQPFALRHTSCLDVLLCCENGHFLGIVHVRASSEERGGTEEDGYASKRDFPP